MSEFKKIRETLRLSQVELAKRLNVTQATISRLESGKVEISPDIFRKLNLLLEKSPTGNAFSPKSALAKYQFDEKFYSFKNGWNAFFITSLNQEENSDLVIVNSLEHSVKASFLIGDMTGHGKNSAYMAFSIKFGFESLLGFIKPELINIETINSFIINGIRLTKNDWKNNPSLIMGLIDTEKSSIEFVNNGMPYPLIITSKTTKFYNQERSPAIDINTKEVAFNKIKVDFMKGDSLIFFSDGLLEIISEKQLLKYANEDLQYFKGDAKAIGKNILRAIKNGLGYLRDDISFLVLSLK